MMIPSYIPTSVTTLVCIDSGVADRQTLLQGMELNAAVLVLDADREGVAQISQALAQSPQITTLHLVSHGAPGCLQLGNGHLSLDRLKQQPNLLQSWQQLTTLVLYGCRVAAGDAGRELIDRLHQATGAAISASQTRTGSAALGGNWQLEVHTHAPSPLAFSPAAQAAFAGVLEPTTVRGDANREYIAFKQPENGNLNTWFMRIDNGLGFYSAGSNGSGTGIDSAMRVKVGDQWVGDSDYVVSIYDENTVTTDPLSIAGLNVNYQIYVDRYSPLARSYVMFENPTNADITVPVSLQSNLAYDQNTVVYQTSSGDKVFTVDDSWIVTDDQRPEYGRAAFGHVLYDIRAGKNPSVKPTSVSMEAFPFDKDGVIDTKGIRADYTVTIPANSRRSLLFFSTNTYASATNVSYTVDKLNENPSQWNSLINFSDQQLYEVLNWDFGGGLIVSPTAGSTPASTTTEAGGTASFDIKLSRQPSSDVTLNFSSSDSSEGTVNTAALTFTPANWNTIQTVQATGVEDAIDDGNREYSIVTRFTSSDSAYAARGPANIAVTNTDNDTAGVTISSLSGNTSETGSTAAFTVVLNSQPTANVTLNFSSSDTTEGTVTPSIVFTAANWNRTQTVTLTGVDDAIDDGNKAYQIATTIASTDPVYKALTLANIRAINLDNNLPNSNPTPRPNPTPSPNPDPSPTPSPNPNADRRIVGTQRNDKLTGMGGNDTILCLAGRDLAKGQGGNDKIRGGNDNDVLYGGAGSDRLYGDQGVNHLVGGADGDRFGLVKGGTQMIKDFQNGIDRLGLRGLKFAQLDIEQQGSKTIVSRNDAVLAVLNDTVAAQITAADFVKG